MSARFRPADAGRFRGGASPRPAVFAVFAVGSSLAVLAGCWTAREVGAPASLWGRNLAAWAVAAALVLAAPGRAGGRVAMAAVVAAVLGLLATLVSPGLSGVHRWIGLGPLRLNAAELLLPVAVVGWTRLRAPAAIGVAALLGLLLAWQPDRSQAAAFAAAVAAGAAARREPLRIAAAMIVGPAAALAAALLRPDPLPPVAEVEGIVGLALSQSLPPAAAMVAGLAIATAAPLLARKASGGWEAGAAALCAWMAVTALAPLAGAYPVPFAGMGVSSILGAWLGLRLLIDLSDDPRRR